MPDDVTILVAEDNTGHFILTKRYLCEAGVSNKIVHLPDGQVTIDYLHKNCVKNGKSVKNKHLLLLDIRMPKIDGIEILELMKKHSQLKNIPVIVVTTSDNPVNTRRCNQLGCDGYIIKPLGEKFIKVVKRMI